MKKGLIFLTIIVLVFASLIGCSSTDNDTEGDVSDPGMNEEPIVVEEVSTEYPLTITDDMGNEVVINAEPKRIISITPSNTEDLVAIGCGDTLVGVSSYALPEVQEKAEFIFEELNSPNIEQIIDLNADLIVLGSHNFEIQQTLAELDLGIPVVKFDPQTIDSVFSTIETFGVITNKQAEATEVLNGMKEQQQSISEKIASIPEEEKVNVFVEISEGFWTAGTGTFMSELVEMAGGINIVEDAGWIQMNEENAIEKNPQVIVTTYGYYVPDVLDIVLDREGWEDVDAIKNQRVVDVNSDLVNRPGPFVMDAVMEFAKAFYPELF